MSGCEWGKVPEMMRVYHDTEWGVPVHDDRQMFEHLTMECLQCGLSWSLILRKREVFRAVFAGFDYDRVADMGTEDVDRILNTDGMIRSRRKIEAVIHNARCFQMIRREHGSFCEWLWAHTDGKTILYEGHDEGRIPASNALSEEISRELRAFGFKYVGPVTIYAHMQACGLVNDHAADCPCRHAISSRWPTVRMPCCGEKGGAL